jgi:glycosyltransferase involved in cell wall biosynthesis
MKVLFIVPYPTEGPSNRYRVEQYLPYLKEHGVQYSLRPFVSSDFFKVLYKKGNHAKKILYFLIASVKRISDLINSAKYDLIFIHIESFPFGGALFERLVTSLNKPVIYDFEDAVYLHNFRDNNKFINYLRCPEKFYKIISLSKRVIVCNKFMKDFVLPFNNNVTVIPTSIDTDKFTLKESPQEVKRPVIGWIGSPTTFYCLESLSKVFERLAEKYDFSLKLIGGKKDYRIKGVAVTSSEWALARDVEDFQSLDIGVYPLPNDERAMAKTPFKTVQYMSVGVPAVVSRVGGNTEMIQDGVNGFLASKEEEWFEKLSLLIKNPELRRKIGLAGRKTVEQRYSVKVNAPKFIDIIQKVYSERLRR